MEETNAVGVSRSERAKSSDLRRHEGTCLRSDTALFGAISESIESLSSGTPHLARGRKLRTQPVPRCCDLWDFKTLATLGIFGRVAGWAPERASSDLKRAIAGHV